ncbi:2-octaprenylphenol hydroxylase [Faunimonas pinastri]|uniref:2-octaprenylphenol hydroxylase n=1 Tax=Faunimonas pinastri TaxID=1855383 RepID=A0A1H9HQ44_9HYPH|nr:2-polyprenylphenol 6-hydroxylase [Faunimonas pinastri]SEQ64435.1 2-octaprenylphenol hydroxylase [Faunimonas pinastri]
MGIVNAYRLARAGWAVARAGGFSFIDLDGVPPRAATAVRIARAFEPRGLDDSERGRRMSTALNRLGPSYVKLGQFLATRPDIVGAEMAETLSGLKDEMPPFPTETAKTIIAANLGRTVEELFLTFSEPLAAASIAQVHQATVMRDGQVDTVAVKVLRPDVRQRLSRDLETFYSAARFIEKNAPQARRLKPIAVVETLERSVVLEMDLRLEAAANSEMAENVSGETDFAVPPVDWSMTGRDVLVTDWVQGTKMRNREAIVAAGHDPKRLARIVVQSFLRHALRDGFFHGDMHEGNLFVDTEGRLVAVDLGIVGRIGKKERRFLAEILYGFIRRDYMRIAEVHIEAGYVPSIHSAEDFAQALRAIGEPIHGQRAADISMAKLLGLLFEVTEIFDMQTRPELILLQKTMVVVEGVARRLDPDFDMWTTADPVVREWIERNLGVQGHVERFMDGMKALTQFAIELPYVLERLDTYTEELERVAQRGVRLDQGTVSEIGREVARHIRWALVALWVMAAVAAGAGVAGLFGFFK